MIGTLIGIDPNGKTIVRESVTHQIIENFNQEAILRDNEPLAVSAFPPEGMSWKEWADRELSLIAQRPEWNSLMWQHTVDHCGALLEPHRAHLRLEQAGRLFRLFELRSLVLRTIENEPDVRWGVYTQSYPPVGRHPCSEARLSDGTKQNVFTAGNGTA